MAPSGGSDGDAAGGGASGQPEGRGPRGCAADGVVLSLRHDAAPAAGSPRSCHCAFSMKISLALDNAYLRMNDAFRFCLHPLRSKVIHHTFLILIYTYTLVIHSYSHFCLFPLQ